MKIKWPWSKTGKELKPSQMAELFFSHLYEESETEPAVSEEDRITFYIDSGGKRVDMSNKPRLEHDGFPPDRELLTKDNEAHLGTKAGLAGMAGRKR